jgi:uncharacterized protein (DUF427 family)
MSVRAICDGTVIAESERTIVVEGNHYFPPDDVDRSRLADSASHTTCPWKGLASYFDVVVGDKRLADAAWYYPDPKPAAAEIAGYVAFWRGVEVLPA